MKILHTSDWHIGRMLYGRKRYDEFEAFLSWLAGTIHTEKVDVLLVAGDVFDTSTPSNRAQALYYRFLCEVASGSCRHVVVIAGNHDSPTFLDAPKELLRSLNVHVIGAASQQYQDEVLLLKNPAGVLEAIICAVPYLRDRDIRSAEPGESIADKERKLFEGIRAHYQKVCELGARKRDASGLDIPMIGMGHLFTAGGQTTDGDGVRDLYVGSLGHVTAHIFPDCIDYLALGHLHVPQKVNALEHMRYSGSPIPMGFGEANQEKSVCLVEFNGKVPAISLLNVPVFQKLERVQGDWDTISARLNELCALNSQAWLEIIYDGDELTGDLRERLNAAISGSSMHILRVKNNRILERVLSQIHDDETLDDLTPHDVFNRCLDAHHIPNEQRQALHHAYQEILSSLYEQDRHAE